MESYARFINFKKFLCVVLTPLLIGLSLYSLSSWIVDIVQLNSNQITEIKDFNSIFYHEFFTAIILVDVIILVASFRYTDRYSLIIRNTGFVVTTVLIRIAFSTTGLDQIILLLSGTLFGVIISYIYSLYEKIDKGDSTKESYAICRKLVNSKPMIYTVVIYSPTFSFSFLSKCIMLFRY